MNAAWHYKEAERLRDCARDADVDLKSFDWRTYFNQAAQVHATLALVGATLSSGYLQPGEVRDAAEGVLYRCTVDS